MALFNLKNPYEAQQYKDYCKRIYDESVNSSSTGLVEVKKKHRQRSSNQNSYLHVVLGFYASEFGYTLEDVKQDLFKELSKDIFLRRRVNKRGQEVEYKRSSRDLDTAEMTLAIERFRNYSASVAGLYIPAPNEEEALFYAEKQMKEYEEYL